MRGGSKRRTLDLQLGNSKLVGKRANKASYGELTVRDHAAARDQSEIVHQPEVGITLLVEGTNTK